MGTLFTVALIVILAGATGGVVNAYLTGDKKLILPDREPIVENGRPVLRLGILGSALVSGFAAFLSWALYGPLAMVSIVGGTAEQQITLNLASIGAAALVGYGGAGWLNSQSESKAWQEIVNSIRKGEQPVPPSGEEESARAAAVVGGVVAAVGDGEETAVDEEAAAAVVAGDGEETAVDEEAAAAVVVAVGEAAAAEPDPVHPEPLTDKEFSKMSPWEAVEKYG